jgi:hypothetical protein
MLQVDMRLAGWLQAVEVHQAVWLQVDIHLREIHQAAMVQVEEAAAAVLCANVCQDIRASSAKIAIHARQVRVRTVVSVHPTAARLSAAVRQVSPANIVKCRMFALKILVIKN